MPGGSNRPHQKWLGFFVFDLEFFNHTPSYEQNCCLIAFGSRPIEFCGLSGFGALREEAHFIFGKRINSVFILSGYYVLPQ
jgi:hypothetical protein